MSRLQAAFSYAWKRAYSAATGGIATAIAYAVINGLQRLMGAQWQLPADWSGATAQFFLVFAIAFLIVFVGNFLLHLAGLHESWPLHLRRITRPMFSVVPLLVVSTILSLIAIVFFGIAIYKIHVASSLTTNTVDHLSGRIDSAETAARSMNDKIDHSGKALNDRFESLKNYASSVEDRLRNIKADLDKQISKISMMEHIDKMLLLRSQVAEIISQINIVESQFLKKDTEIPNVFPGSSASHLELQNKHDREIGALRSNLTAALTASVGANTASHYIDDPLNKIDTDIKQTREMVRKISGGE